jgi:tRNA(His) guanylyltransferase
MKECEIFSDLRVPCGSKIVIRADGRKFSHLASDLGLEKPYDQDFVKIMVAACQEFFQEFSPSFIYTFSDEINILLEKIPFSGRLEKINSVSASFLTGALTQQIFRDKRFCDHFKDSKIPMKPISFDSRVIPLGPQEVVAYFKGRQDESWRNCLNGYAYWTLRKEYSKKEAVQILNKKKSHQLHDILFERKINIAEVPSWQRRGVGIYRKNVVVEGYNPVNQEDVLSKRLKPFTDWELPVFSEEFFSSKQILMNIV